MWERLSNKLDELSGREKVILLSTVLALMLVLALEFIWAPLWKNASERELKLQQVVTEEESLLRQQETLSAAVARDPNAVLREQNAALRERLEDQEQELKSSLSRLVAPTEIPRVLMALMQESSGLRVQQVLKLPTQKLQQGEGKDAAVLYSHRVRIVLEADYFSALDYVRKIETGEERLRLLELDYETSTYPKGILTLDFETLGLDERWLGV